MEQLTSRSYRPIVLFDRGKEAPSGYYVLISHAELDGLVGRLMQMCDLTGDLEQRKALKDTIKKTSRDWLDDVYSDSGYEKYTGLVDGITAHKINQ